MTFDRFLFGVCYYPEHWDSSRHDDDLRRIAAAGFDYVRIGEGAWGYFEPEEGHYQFDLFDRVIALCRKYKLKVIFGTPTYCAPAWVATGYPEVLRWNYDRIPMGHGSRRNFNYTSPKYIELSDKICTALAQHYKAEPQIIGWQLDNEFNCHMDVSYSPSDSAAFRVWLKAKYKTLATLNKTWGCEFWSQQYNDWQQVDLPHPTAAMPNPHTLLDETRFISDCVIAFARRQADILRKHNPRWFITHNGLFANINGPGLAGVLDVFGHDQYPSFNPTDWAGNARPLIQARSLTFPYGILEQQSGPGGQMTYLQPTPRPGQIRLWTWQSVGHGAAFLSYFRWRTCPYGAEQHWHGVLDADDRDTRRLAEVTRTGKELHALPKAFLAAAPARCVAVMQDFDNEVNDRRINTYPGAGRHESHHWTRQLTRSHIPVDIVWPDSDLSGYRLLVLPHFKLVARPLVKKIEAFVRAGGVLVLSAQSGLADQNLHVVEMPLPGLFSKLAGVDIRDWSTLPGTAASPAGDQRIDARMNDGRVVPLGSLVERLEPTTAKAIAIWATPDPLLAGAAAITVNTVGKGRVYYVGGYLHEDSVIAMLNYLTEQLHLRSIVTATGDVEAIRRIAGTKAWTLLLNHSPEPQRVSNIPPGKVTLDAEQFINGELLLPPHGVALVTHRKA